MKASFSGSRSGGILSVSDGAKTDKISLTGNYTYARWNLSSDGSGGTMVVDPPVPHGASPSGSFGLEQWPGAELRPLDSEGGLSNALSVVDFLASQAFALFPTSPGEPRFSDGLRADSSNIPDIGAFAVKLSGLGYATPSNGAPPSLAQFPIVHDLTGDGFTEMFPSFNAAPGKA
jgi:hypothetical protein